MSESENLWKPDGTPRQQHPLCPFCGADKIRSKFNEAWCDGRGGCKWKGTLLELVEFDLQRRPGAQLLELLQVRGVSLGRFAFDIGLGSTLAAAQANIRHYTHPTPGSGTSSLTWPKAAMVVRWATYFGVDVGRFYQPTKFTADLAPVYWTDAEKQMLKERFAAGEPLRKIAEELGRTESSVMNMRHYLHLRRGAV